MTRGARRRVPAGLALGLLVAASASAQPLRVRLVNGTTGGPGSADLLTLYRLGEGMEPVATVENPGAEAVVERPPGPRRPFLLQATHGGVNYNQPVPPGSGGDVTLTVYETFSTWAESDIGLLTWRVLYRRLPRSEGDALRVDQIFIVENRSAPPRTFLDPDGSLRFRLPPEGVRLDLPQVSSTGETGMPVPQSSFPVGGEGDFAIATAFKPGETEIVLSYHVAYEGARHEVALRAPRASPEALLLAAPADITMTLPDDAPPGWETLAPDEAAGLIAARKFDLAAGELVTMRLAGGSVRRGLPPVSSGEGTEGMGESRVGRLPDPTLASKWAIALLMGAALGFGLLHRAFAGPRQEPRERKD